MKFSPTELIIVAIVALALFGGTLLPKIFKQMKESKKALKEGLDELKESETSETAAK